MTTPHLARAGDVRAGSEASPAIGTVLARWTYTPAEWRAYTSAELRRSLPLAALVVVGSPVLSTLAIGLGEGDWNGGFAVSLSVGAFLGLLVGLMAWLKHRRNRNVADAEVIVGRNAVVIHGHSETVHDGTILFRSARVLEEPQPAILEVVSLVPQKQIQDRKQPKKWYVLRECRIPIPAGRENEARAVAGALHRLHAMIAPMPAPSGARQSG